MQHSHVMRLFPLPLVALAVTAAACSAIGGPASGRVNNDAIVAAFADIEPTTDPTYGFAPDNPVPVGQFGSGARTSFAASHYLIVGLRKDGRPLRVLARAQVGEGGTDGWTDGWTVVPEGTTDTLEVYTNVYRSGRIRVPQGLTFEPPPIRW